MHKQIKSMGVWAGNGCNVVPKNETVLSVKRSSIHRYRLSFRFYAPNSTNCLFRPMNSTMQIYEPINRNSSMFRKMERILSHFRAFYKRLCDPTYMKRKEKKSCDEIKETKEDRHARKAMRARQWLNKSFELLEVGRSAIYHMSHYDWVDKNTLDWFSTQLDNTTISMPEIYDIVDAVYNKYKHKYNRHAYHKTVCNIHQCKNIDACRVQERQFGYRVLRAVLQNEEVRSLTGVLQVCSLLRYLLKTLIPHVELHIPFAHPCAFPTCHVNMLHSKWGHHNLNWEATCAVCAEVWNPNIHFEPCNSSDSKHSEICYAEVRHGLFMGRRIEDAPTTVVRRIEHHKILNTHTITRTHIRWCRSYPAM